MNLVDLATQSFEHYILILIRVAGLFVFAPFFSSQIYPATVKASCALVYAWAIFPNVPVARGEFIGEIGMFPYMIFNESIVSFGIGFSARILFNGILMAGSLMGLYIGYGITSTIDPFSGAQNNILAQMYYLFGVLAFVVLGGPHLLIRAMTHSFDIIPIGHLSFSDDLVREIARISNDMWIVSLELSGPVLLVTTFITMALGILTKAVPQMNIFAVGFLIKIAFGLAVLLFTVESSVDYFEDVFRDLYDNLISIFSVLRS